MTNDRLKFDNNSKLQKSIIKDKNSKIHFVGLGGIGMSGLAKFLLELGYRVSGSDIKDGPTMFSISAQGGTVYIGHVAENLDNVSLVVISSAIKASNPEVIEAQKRNIPIVHRSQLLEALMSGLGLEEGVRQISIGVSGTHGKTTTSGMVSLIFEYARTNPSIVVGGQMPYLNTNSKVGTGKYFIAELDESDGSIELYSPDINIITNLEEDHLDHYVNGFEQLLGTFENYVNKLGMNSKIIINVDCAGNRKLLEKINHPGIILYSTEPTRDDFKYPTYTVKEISGKGFNITAKVYKNDEYVGEMQLGVPGVHNVSNGLAAIAAAMECGIDFNIASQSLQKFSGMKRRFQVLGVSHGAKIVDDYAHHPTEVQATLRAAKSVVESEGSGRVVAIFQPHRYSRLAALWNDFVMSFKDADVVYVCDVYSAGETQKDGISSERFAKEVDHDNVKYIPGPVEKISEYICSEIKHNDIVLTLGAGDITKLGYIMIEKMGLDKVITA